nr:wall-associated receptor kinase 3-like [Ipomoea trifida]
MDTFLLYSLVFTVLYVSLSIIYFITKPNTSKPNVPPGSTGWPVFGENIDMMVSGPEKYISDRMKKYSSDVFKTSIVGEKVAVFCGAAGNKFLFTNENTLLTTWWPTSVTKPLLFPADDLKKIAITNRANLHEILKPENLKHYISTMDSMAKEYIAEKWAPFEEVKVYPLSKYYAFALACKLFLSIEGYDEVKKLLDPFLIVTSGMFSLPLNLPGTAYNRAMKGGSMVRHQLVEVIKKRKAEAMMSSSSGKVEEEGQDVLGRLLSVTDEEGQHMNEVEIYNNIIGLILPSYHSSSAAITFVLKYLAELPHIYDQVYKEQIEIAKSKGPNERLCWEDIQKMKYSWNVACEALRLFPPGQGGFRETVKDFTYAGFTIPKGWKVFARSSKSNNYPIAKPNCDDHCGNVSLPFPFGLTKDCYLNEDFFINCSTGTDGSPKPLLRRSDIEVRSVSVEGQLSVMKGIARKCHEEFRAFFRPLDKDVSSDVAWITLSKFYVNQTANKFVAVGCNTIATVSGYEDERSYETGCIASCNRFGDVVNGTCSGIGCCQMTDIPILAKNVNFTLDSMAENRNTEGVVNCSYAFVVKKDEFNFSSDILTRKWEVEKLPIVIDWIVSNDTCSNSRSTCQGNTTCVPFEGPDGGYRCACDKGYEGNPYLHPGCLDIDECSNGQNNCSENATCENKLGGFSCHCKEGYREDGKGDCKLPSKGGNKVNVIVLGVSLGTITLFISGFCVYLGYRRRKSVRMKEKFFKENGGLILQQRIAQGPTSSRTTRIFTAEELKKATNNYDQTRIVGEGG